jgi:hypothetical protein
MVLIKGPALGSGCRFESRRLSLSMEVAGIVLAIVPLCITALEHHGSVARGFKAWFNYQAKYARFAEELGLRLVEFDQSIRRVLRAAGISDDEQTDAMIKSCSVEFWRDTDQETKLKAHFGERQYKLGFAFILRNIKEAVLDVCRNMDGLQDLVSSSENVSQHGPCDVCVRH